jgi:hypothetical protein
MTNGATITIAPIRFESGELTSIARPKATVLRLLNPCGSEVGQQLSSLNSFSDGLMPRYFGTRPSL